MVALLNIQIPQCVGSVINVLTEICQTKTDSTKQVMLQLTQPACILARMYLTQVCKLCFLVFLLFYYYNHTRIL